MSESYKKDSTLSQVEKLFIEEERRLVSSKEWAIFSKSYESFRKAAFKASLPFDPRFNSVHWGLAVSSLCREVAFGFCWMNAYARHYKGQVRKHAMLADVDFHVSYFADNCITRIDSCRDKIALMVWAFYCPFNPEKRPETLDYQKVMERLRYPLRAGLTLKNHDIFLKQLGKLKGKDFERIEKYRHYKVHRIEPRIEIYGVKSHHGWDYMLPLYKENEKQDWENELKKLYPNQDFREHIKKGCYINGVLFSQRKINDSLWDYDEVYKHIKTCMEKLFNSTASCFGILTRRSPLRRRSKKSQRIGGVAKS